MTKTDRGRDYYIRKAFLENYGQLMQWGGMYLGHWLIPATFIVNSSTHVLFLVYTAYLTMDDLTILAEAVHFIVLLSTACTSIINSLYQRPHLDSIFEAMGRRFYDYGQIMDEETKNEIESHKKNVLRRKRVLPRMFIISVVISAAALSVRPLIEYLIHGKFKDYQNDGINRNIPCVCWYPLDPTVPWQYTIAVLLQCLLITGTPGVVFGTDIIFLCMAEDFCLQLEIISINLRRSTQRAKTLFNKTVDNAQINKFLRVEEFHRKCLQYCIGQAIQHHIIIINLFYHFKKVNRVILLLLLISATFLLCLSGLIFASDKVSPLSKVTFFFFLSTELVHIFIFCWYGEQIQIRSEAVSDEFYRSEWTSHSRTMKHHLLMVQNRSYTPLRLSAAGFVDVNLAAYSSVLNSAYSYFNLLNAVRH